MGRVWALGVARHLESIHRAEHLFADVKPANVGITQGGEPTLLDFGLIRPLEDGKLHKIVGTPYYMPPESMRRAPLTKKADAWALWWTHAEQAAPCYESPIFDTADAHRFERLETYIDNLKHNGGINAKTILHYEDPMLPYFAKLARADAAMCNFGLSKLAAHPEERRANLAQLMRVLESWPKPGSKLDNSARRYVRTWAANFFRRRWGPALDACRQAAANERGVGS